MHNLGWQCWPGKNLNANQRGEKPRGPWDVSQGRVYQPMSSLQRCSNLTWVRGLVKRSAQLLFMWTLTTWTVPLRTWSWKWWYLIERCFVCGQTASEVAMVRQLWLSSNTSDLSWPEKMWVLEMVMWSIKLWADNSWMRVHNGRRSCIQALRAWYAKCNFCL